MKEEILKILSPKYGEKYNIEFRSWSGGKIVIKRFDYEAFKNKILGDNDISKGMAAFGLKPIFECKSPIYLINIHDIFGDDHTIYVINEKAYVVITLDYGLNKIESYEFDLGLWKGLEVYSELPGLYPSDSTNPHMKLYDPIVFLEVTSEEWYRDYKKIYYNYMFINNKPLNNIIKDYKSIKISQYNKEFFKIVYKDP